MLSKIFLTGQGFGQTCRYVCQDLYRAEILDTDKEHLHLHIVANKVDNEGEPTGKGLIVERGIKAARKLTREYGLRPVRGKNLELTHLEALHPTDAKRYRLYQAIQRNLPAATKILIYQDNNLFNDF